MVANGLIDNKWKSIKRPIELNELIKTDAIKNFKYSGIIGLPSEFQLKTLSSSDCVITTKGLKEYLLHLTTFLSDQIIEIDELIDPNGEVKHSLSEPEINKVLRQVFAKGSKYAALIFLNGIINPIHQNNLKNVLFTARVKSIIPEI